MGEDRNRVVRKVGIPPPNPNLMLTLIQHIPVSLLSENCVACSFIKIKTQALGFDLFPYVSCFHEYIVVLSSLISRLCFVYQSTL